MMKVEYMERGEVMQAIDKATSGLKRNLDEHEIREFKKHDQIEARIESHHLQLLSKIDKLTEILISDIRNSK